MADRCSAPLVLTGSGGAGAGLIDVLALREACNQELKVYHKKRFYHFYSFYTRSVRFSKTDNSSSSWHQDDRCEVTMRFPVTANSISFVGAQSIIWSGYEDSSR